MKQGRPREANCTSNPFSYMLSGIKCISYLLYSISDSVKFVIQIARQKKKNFRLINHISFSFFFLHMTCTHLVNTNLKLAKFWMEWNTKELSLQAFSTLNSHYRNDTFLITFRNQVASEKDALLLLQESYVFRNMISCNKKNSEFKTFGLELSPNN